MQVGEFNSKYYINVASIMYGKLPSPKLRKKFVYDKDDGFVRIITVECEI